MMLDVNNSHSSLHGRGGNGQKQQQLPALGQKVFMQGKPVLHENSMTDLNGGLNSMLMTNDVTQSQAQIGSAASVKRPDNGGGGNEYFDF